MAEGITAKKVSAGVEKGKSVEVCERVPALAIDEEDSSRESPAVSDTAECAICLQPFIQPVQLPCKHIFCYLCVKGIALQSRRCAMCRREIPPDYVNCPKLVNIVHDSEKDGEEEEVYRWFYEGRNGWWQYDSRTENEIEREYKSQKSTTVELLIAGFMYIIDFENMVQLRQNMPSRRRRIKRDLATASKKGVAGIKYNLDGPELERQGDIKGAGRNGAGGAAAAAAGYNGADSPIDRPQNVPKMYSPDLYPERSESSSSSVELAGAFGSVVDGMQELCVGGGGGGKALDNRRNSSNSKSK